MSLHISPVRTYIAVFATLLVLTALTVWAAFQNFGAFNNLVAMAIAATKAAVVVLYFMHVKYSTKLTSMVVVGTVLFLAILFVFLVLDFNFVTWTPTPFSQYGSS
ncbi:MAG: cytochrome C oxidase subunit IV family protein [Acidobacteria bacterium]|nr:cytochrome C oxidase subunit IV family protein [Acidobacteriota bacterium]